MTVEDGFSIDELFRNESRALRQFLGRKLSDPSDVEDIVQESFTRLFQARQKGAIQNVRGFLYRVAANLVIDRYRSTAYNTKKVTLDDLTETAEQLRSELDSPEQQTISRQKVRAVLEAIRSLPPKCKRVFILHRFKQMTHAEIAEEMQISTKMVEKHIAKAVRVCAEKSRPF